MQTPFLTDTHNQLQKFLHSKVTLYKHWCQNEYAQRIDIYIKPSQFTYQEKSFIFFSSEVIPFQFSLIRRGKEHQSSKSSKLVTKIWSLDTEFLQFVEERAISLCILIMKNVFSNFRLKRLNNKFIQFKILKRHPVFRLVLKLLLFQ